MKKVFIQKFGNDTWVVMVAGRNKYQRYSIAQFYAKTHSFEYVMEWVASKGLILIEKEELK